ncbi:TauD/TfdA family dioxygenase [Pseudomonas savastanoi pv. phaseolicola]|uniref:TauD/TfdA family dioxygenase n=6 Tax=Pseudomonas savastanoi TaxID=29438 RepID=A0A0P9R8U2_PSESG|nr:MULTISPECIES: TauD/TfdA family dioxygenase [Pseudomonas]EFW79602.1 TauD/TfdA family dioxygenase [Pseudomonas savastanoi pv. glycinea str. B076]EFW85432.1 TauD/TfdA family dioxygenase [Pseudomonas savastanoi pv. glycinea str. race 4]KPX41374.1 TauD/TfdA family dioxygenase [Pseudomonas savastanoi pv. glycinea]KPY16202.1 TauD/TfdA family dioxygenase [Pseudomonas savastanoi pv. phaseolicola]MBN4174939.1 Alpha-ketoglutarate-dependent taurine dioxygenase [Pseudomonas savastanoi pv. phaseolicola]
MDQMALKAIEGTAGAPRAPYHSITVNRLTPIIGAEVGGVDLSQPLSAKQLTEIRRAFLENHVLVFRDQHLTVEQHKAFGRLFGPLRALPVESIDGDDPELVVVRANAQSRFAAGELWHTDGTADLEPSMGSMLYVKETPAIGTGGDTLFANMHLAIEMLSPAMQAFLGELTAIHDGEIPWKGYQPPANLPKSEHPVVVRHPETGRRSLFVNSGFTSHIVQLSAGESRTLLNMLFDLIAREPSLSCRVRWEPNTLVFWDNRCTQHHAVWDYFPHSRYGERVTILGGRPKA